MFRVFSHQLLVDFISLVYAELLMSHLFIATEFTLQIINCWIYSCQLEIFFKKSLE